MTCLTADPGKASLIDSGPVPYFRGGCEIIFYRHSPLSADSRSVVVSYKGKYLHKVLVNSLVKLVQEKSVVR